MAAPTFIVDVRRAAASMALTLPQRDRLRPVPFCTLMTVWLMLGTVIRAHEPGLSALDVHVHGRRIVAALSIAAPDVDLIGRLHGSVADLAGTAVHVSVRGARLETVVDSVVFEGGAARVSLSFTSGDGPQHILITSDIPRRLARGHRQIVTIRSGDAIVAERLIDAVSNQVEADLEPDPGDPGNVHGYLAATWRVVPTMFNLGIRHILAGFDHLVFVAGLLLASSGVRRLAVVLTAFTAAHSVTLALAATGAVGVSPGVVEPLIAASIAWVGAENLVWPRRDPRWMVVFAFGLIHGFGFAGAFSELNASGPPLSTAISLAAFNGGVEAGQLAVALLLWPIVRAIRARPHLQARFAPICSASIGIAGAYWLIERLG